LYCQNYQISQGDTGRVVTPHVLAQGMLELHAKGCSNLEPVSPSHHLPGFLEALAIAAGEGMALPVVYNTNGYETPDTLDLLEGIVDIYLPDLKYASDHYASKYSDVSNYVQTARSAILKMYSQVSNLVLDMQGRAIRGLILRHLVLPGDLSGTRETLMWIRHNLPLTVTISLMAQYTPLHEARDYPPLDRPVTSQEYDRCLDLASELGFENVFVQDLTSQSVGTPDFALERPFNWGE
jgi:putative pyruvate formate lyase activating enzyme